VPLSSSLHHVAGSVETPMESVQNAFLRVANCAARQSDPVALTVGSERVNYGSLIAGSMADARSLVGSGVRNGVRVGLAVPRSIDLVRLVLASIASGGTYVPLDPHLPSDRLAYMVEDAGVSLVVLPSAERPKWLSDSVRSIAVDELRAATPGELDVPASDDLAYVIYTSGSTGRPKGVRITHANLMCILDAWGSVAHTSPDSIFLFHSTLSFDASLTEFLWPLSQGLSVAILPDETRSGFEAGFGPAIEAGRVTHVQCTPTRAILLLADPVSRRALRHVKQVLLGGEALPPALVHELKAAGIETVTNIYGPTECSIWSFSHDVESTVGASVPIGRPLPGVVARVVDSQLREVAAGIEGELIIGGPFVGDGYEGRPDLTAHSFKSLGADGQRADDVGAAPALQAYRTGDRVVCRADGVHEFLGRMDTQVKLRGQRIELGEIEAVLLEQPGITHAVAAVVGHGLGDDRLFAYVIVDPAMAFDPTGIRLQLAARLPGAMVPTDLIELDSFPLTPSGKVDRRALPEPSPATFAPLVNDEGTTLSRVLNDFSLIFGRSVGPDDDFFAIGGHSLLAVELLSRIADRKGIDLPLSVLLDAPTPRLLAERASNPGGLTTASSLIRFGNSSARRRLYLVHGAGGNVLGFRELAQQLSRDVEVIGIQATGVEPGRTPDRTMAEMVERYTEAILVEDPLEAGPKEGSGPGSGTGSGYLLGGYSDGGFIALHLAQALRARGASIAGLVILDSFEAEALPPTRIGRLANVLRNSSDRGSRNYAIWARTSWRAWRHRAGSSDANAEAAERLGYLGVDAIVEQAVHVAGDPGPVPAPALLLRSSDANPVYWFDYSVVLKRPSSTTTVWLPGHHGVVFSGLNAERAAREIKGFVSNLQQRPH
jgi:amino acid adenylation domain-containing protein